MMSLLDRRFPIHDGAALRADVDQTVLLLPGATNVPEQSTALAAELASRGHLVVQVDLGFGIQDLDVTIEDSAAGALAVYSLLEQGALVPHVDRVNDVLDHLPTALDGLGVPWVDQAPVLIGHSHGGGVAVEVCRQRSCAAVVNLDGPVYTEVRQQGLDTPWLHAASRDPALLTSEDLDRLGWAAYYPEVKAAELSWVDEARSASAHACALFVDEAGHLDLTDMPFLVPGHRSDLDPATAHARVTDVVLATLDAPIEAVACKEIFERSGTGLTLRP